MTDEATGWQARLCHTFPKGRIGIQIGVVRTVSTLNRDAACPPAAPPVLPLLLAPWCCLLRSSCPLALLPLPLAPHWWGRSFLSARAISLASEGLPLGPTDKRPLRPPRKATRKCTAALIWALAAANDTGLEQLLGFAPHLGHVQVL